jgi:hypothetical protein
MRVSHKKLLIAVLGVLVLIYGVWQARDFLRGPRIYLESPKEGEILGESLLYVKGQALDVSKFMLNGRTIFTDENGNFEEKILLARGVNYVEIYAEDKFGHQKKIGRTIFLK